MQGYSLAGVTSSDISTQVIVDLMKGPTDPAGSNGKEILGIPPPLTAYLMTTYGHVPDMDTQHACSSLDADTIESFPVGSPVSYDDIQSETISPRVTGNTVTNVLDGVLDCDCRVSVHSYSHFDIPFAHSSSFTG